MGHSINVSVIGGDARLIYAAKRFAACGYPVRTFGLPADGLTMAQTLAEAAEADILVCGLPFTKDGTTVFAPLSDGQIAIREFSGLMTGGQTLFAGSLPETAVREMKAAGVKVNDYFTDASFTAKNAELTAEALLGILITELPCTLRSAPMAISGFGRIGSALTEKLTLLGADVTVFARRKAQRTMAEALGAQALPFYALKECCGRYRALVNTVPAPVITGEALANLPRNCLLTEAAGAPYGIDAAAAKTMGFPFISASGLPGKYAPETAGEAIADTVLRLCREVKYNGTS